MEIDTPQLRLAMGDLLPNLDLNASGVQQMLRDTRAHLISLEQFRPLSRAVQNSAPLLTMPLLVMQSVDDPVARHDQTRRLIAKIPRRVFYVEVPDEPNINRRSHPGHAQMEAAVLQFIEGALQRQITPA
jgi:pimeloyl-ACP methyl ester carboxylesterase